MASSDTPAPAVPLDGPLTKAEQFAVLLRVVSDTSFACGEWSKDEDEPYEAVSDRASAAQANLTAFVDRLLADAALLDRAEAKVLSGLNVTVEIGHDSAVAGVWVEVARGGESAKYATFVRGANVREALSRALPEGGL